jgi:hypothetical protein
VFDLKKIAVKMAVTFVEALLASLTLVPVELWTQKALMLAAAGAVGAVLSLVYNVAKQYNESLT